ncbi:MAG: hypothetical protein VKI83_12165 [Synechococcaceae cyanobacterium]|nr:hypothetical protein [Synechococcaceae cyanobacterium]
MSERSDDPRAHVDSWILNNQIDYSLGQLRLVGVLLLGVLLARLLVLLFSGPDSDLLNRLSAISALATWLPLLPLGISLYLLGGGRSRLPREPAFTTLVHHSLLPQALVCGLALPGVILVLAARAQGLSDLTPYQLELLSLQRLGTAVLLSVLAGLGLLLLKRQGDAAIERLGSTPGLFFEAGPRRRSRRRRVPTG